MHFGAVLDENLWDWIKFPKMWKYIEKKEVEAQS